MSDPRIEVLKAPFKSYWCVDEQCLKCGELAFGKFVLRSEATGWPTALGEPGRWAVVDFRCEHCFGEEAYPGPFVIEETH